MHIHLGKDIRQTNCPSRHRGYLGGFRGQTLKSFGKLSNGWTDLHQLWFTSADSSGNGHRLNTSRPSIPQGAFGGGGFRLSQIQKIWGSCQTAGPICTKCGTHAQIHLGMDIAKQIAIRDTRGHFGVLGGQTFKSLENLSNGWTDWHQIWHTCADSSGNGYTPNKLPLETQGVFGGF